MFSSRNVRCNRCGQKMKKIADDYMICLECDNEAFLDSEDPENPGHPLQLIAPYDNSSAYDHGDDRPIGCIACDSDAYPICRNGCSLIDD